MDCNCNCNCSCECDCNKSLKAEAIDSLIDSAKKVLLNAYAPYSKFRVGAAILTETGNVYVGCNVEDASFGGTICAERSAAVSCISTEGKVKFRAIAVASEIDDPAPPCGICRQFLSQFADIDTPVFMVSTKSEIVKMIKLGDLIPFAFTDF